MNPEKLAELAELAEEITEAGMVAAKATACKAAWYHSARADMAHAANCFAVAASLRSLSGKRSSTDGEGAR